MDDHNDHKVGQARATGPNRQRQRVLELVRERDEALDAAELAAQMGLHVTTVRFHLDALCSEGVVERTRITCGGVGRPRTGYLAVRDRLDYQSLAEILGLELGDTAGKRRRRAEAAGRRWANRIPAESAYECGAGQHVPDSARPRKTLEEEAATVATVFARMGFSPELTPAATSTTGNQQTIRLHTCPIRDLARAHPEVACALHRGLLHGLLANPAATKGHSTAPRPDMQAELEPFVEPDLCFARVIADD